MLSSPSTKVFSSVGSVLPGAPPKAEYIDTRKDLQSWIETVVKSRRKGVPYQQRKTIPNIDYSTASNIYEEINTEDNKVRFNWSFIGQTAVFEMPDAPHDTPGLWLGAKIHEIVSGLKHAPCGNASVFPTGSQNVYLANVRDRKKAKYVTGAIKGRTRGSHFQPDASIHLQYIGENEDARPIYASPRPRVVLETALSEDVIGALNKACEYLYNSDNEVHAVIICDMTTAKRDDHFVAKISVWVRVPNDNVTEPLLDPCQASQAEHKGDEMPLEELGDNASQVTYGSGRGSNRPPEFAIHQHEKDKEGKYIIMNRSGWKTILNEEDSREHDESLDLNVYDFLRVCDSKNARLVPEQHRWIPLELRSLRIQIQAQLAIHRDTFGAIKPKPENRFWPSFLRLVGFGRHGQHASKVARQFKEEASKQSGSS